MNIPTKQKHRHQVNIEGKSSKYNPRTTVAWGNGNNQMGFQYTRAIINWKAALVYGATDRKDDGKPANLKLGGSVGMAANFLSGVVDEELDKGELADIEDFHESKGRSYQSMWRRDDYKKKSAVMVKATAEATTFFKF